MVLNTLDYSGEWGWDRVGACHIGEGIEEGSAGGRGAERRVGGVGPVGEPGVLQLGHQIRLKLRNKTLKLQTVQQEKK